MSALVMTEPERRRAAGEEQFIAGPYSRSLGVGLVAGTIGRISGTEVFENDCIAALLRAIVLQEVLVTFSPPWEVTA